MPTSIATLSLVAFLACASAAPELAQEAPSPASSCASFDEGRCLDTAECTLVQEAEKGPYLCREAAPPCETDFNQAKDTADACTAKQGCRFESGYCYCAPGVTCICGGGPPPRCLAEETSGVENGAEDGPSGDSVSQQSPSRDRGSEG